MEFLHAQPQNWSKTFTVWIQDIRVAFDPRTVCQELSGGALRGMRSCTRHAAAVMMALFSLHCLRPHLDAAPVPIPIWRDVEATVNHGVPGEVGLASYYGWEDGFEASQTASGEPFQPEALTCAHRSLPFGTLVEVENRETGARVVLRVNDRGPFIDGRMVDVTPRAARLLGLTKAGVAEVVLRPVHSLVQRIQPSQPAPVARPHGLAASGPQLLQVFQPFRMPAMPTVPRLHSSRRAGFQSQAVERIPGAPRPLPQGLLPPFLHRES